LIIYSKKTTVTSVTDYTVKDRDVLVDRVASADILSALLESYSYKHILWLRINLYWFSVLYKYKYARRRL